MPIYLAYEFSFFRCVSFEDSWYGKTVSDLHGANLRENKGNGRHSKLFPGEKISYWADSVNTARGEIKKHNPGNNILTFWAYDDATSTFPTTSNKEPLVIIKGSSLGFDKILEQIEADIELSSEELRIIDRISKEKPDCLAYQSLVNDNCMNFLFFEKGFQKLAIREVRLRLGDKRGKNCNTISCAFTSDFSPKVENYGCYFEFLTKVKMNHQYLKTDEYILRNQILKESFKKIKEF